ncbi:hypothetical protein HY605_00375 [Candidatus Peregrinibacteria bacterium]|nr:hypothetical protein [Candidatus Peregrinibacteria bacterium]
MANTNVKLNYIILCDAIVDTGGKVNLLGIFSNIFTKTFPSAHPKFAIALNFTGEPAEHTLTLRIIDTSGNEVMPPSPQLKFRCPEFGEASIGITVENLQIRAPGFLTVQVIVDGNKIGEKDLIVSKM